MPDNENQISEDDWAAALAEQSGAGTAGAVAEKVAFDQLVEMTPPQAAGNLELVLDIPVQLTVELGRTRLPIRHLLQLAQGSVVELDGLAGEPMNVLVNGRLIAQGEVVVVNDRFGIRLTDIIDPSKRMQKL